jgi:apolipoprotein N-acyltransferase
MKVSRLPLLLVLAAASGLLLFLADFPVHAWPLQLVALVPLLVGLRVARPSRRGALLAGVVLGLCHTVPIAVALEFPPLMGAALAGYLTVFWVAFALGARAVSGWRAPFGPVAVACVAVVVDFVAYSVFPAFGTAQCSARVLAAGPWLVQIVDLGGIFGLVLVTVGAQALAVALALDGERRRATAVTLALWVALPLGYDALAWRRPPVGTVRVAAVGWTYDELARRGLRDHDAVLTQVYEPLLAQAVTQGAKLVVSPEAAFQLRPAEHEPVLARVAALARRHGVTLAFGYIDLGPELRPRENHLVFFRPDGSAVGPYLKTHLIPAIERYTAGRGDLVQLPLEGFTLSGMICQDDNFTDLARAVGRRRAHLVAVPSNDWRQVKDYHLSSSIFRPIENRYAIVRGVTNGTSAIVSPRGEVIVRKDHFEEGAGVIVADVPLHRPGSLYSRAGDWVAGAAGLALVVGLLLRRRWRGTASGALVVGLLLGGGAAGASGVSFTRVHLVLPDCTAPTRPGQWPTNAPLGVVAYVEGCTSAPGGPATCSCDYLPPAALVVEQAVPGGGWKPVPGSFRRSRRQCQELERLLYDRALLPGTYQVRAGRAVFGPLTVVTAEVADTARVPAVLPRFQTPCREAPVAARPAPPSPAAAPGAVPPRRGCASCAVGASGRAGDTAGLALLALAAALRAGRRRPTPCRGRSSR